MDVRIVKSEEDKERLTIEAKKWVREKNGMLFNVKTNELECTVREAWRGIMGEETAGGKELTAALEYSLKK